MNIPSSFKTAARTALTGALVFGAIGVVSAFAQETAPAAADAAAVPTPDKGDTTWMLVSTILVIAMTIPGLALFYGGLVRSKNVLSVLMQVLAGFSILALLWVVYGYTLAFGGDGSGAYIGGFDKLFLAGVMAAKVSWNTTKVSSGITTPSEKVAAVESGVTPARNSLSKPPI